MTTKLNLCLEPLILKIKPCFLAVCLLAAPRAWTQQVTDAADSGAGTLRTVVSSAAPGSTITFAGSLSGKSIMLMSGEILLNKNLTIDASALTGGIQINGSHASRVFEVSASATNTLICLTMSPFVSVLTFCTFCLTPFVSVLTFCTFCLATGEAV
jgi:hypothetical protein